MIDSAAPCGRMPRDCRAPTAVRYSSCTAWVQMLDLTRRGAAVLALPSDDPAGTGLARRPSQRPEPTAPHRLDAEPNAPQREQTGWASPSVRAEGRPPAHDGDHGEHGAERPAPRR